MKRIAVVLAMLAALAATALVAQQQRDVEIKIHKITDTVYWLEGQGGNIGLSVGGDGVLMIDDQFAPLSDKIEAAIKTLTDKPVEYLVNTHWHQDHTGGNEHFGKDAPIIAHENVRTRMEKGQEVLGRKVEPAPAAALPVVTFADGVSVHFNGEEIKIIHIPGGHTDGDSVVYFTKSNVIHTGDLFFNGLFPFVDRSSGGNVLTYIKNVQTVIDMIDEKTAVIAGHGPQGTVADLKSFHKTLSDVVATVEAAIKAGQTLEQMKADKILAAWDEWGAGFMKTEQFLEIVYADVNEAK